LIERLVSRIAYKLQLPSFWLSGVFVIKLQIDGAHENTLTLYQLTKLKGRLVSQDEVAYYFSW